MTQYSSFVEIIEAFPSPAALAAATEGDVAVSAVRMWKSRNHIPAAKFHRVVAAAKAHGLEIDYPDLYALQDRADAA
jgi:hypothetical protein